MGVPVLVGWLSDHTAAGLMAATGGFTAVCAMANTDPVTDSPEVAERTLVAVSNPIASLELDEVRRALAKLPEDQREALILIGAGGLSYEEVSEICGCAIGTIKSRVSRARDRLAALLEDGAYDQDDMLPSNAMGNLIAQLDSLRGAAIAA